MQPLSNLSRRLSWLLLPSAFAISCSSGNTKSDLEADADAPPQVADAAETASPPTIVRDTRGVPHVYADTLDDVFYGLGYAQAEDRLFQMHYRRLVMRGQLAEHFAVPDVDEETAAFNTKLVLSDRRTRTIGYARRAEISQSVLSDEHLSYLQNYAAGVNAYVQTLGGQYPEAFVIADITTFDPWVPTDSILAWDWVGWHFDGVVGAMARELANLADCESANGCDPVPCEFPIDEDAAVVQPPAGGIWPPNQMAQAGGIHRRNVEVKASHGWVVHGSRTTTGKPTLNGEPQLILEAPSTWHEFHLDAEDLNARGVGIAGAPGVFIFRAPRENPWVKRSPSSALGRPRRRPVMASS